VNMTNFGGGAHPDAANSRARYTVNLLYDASANLHAVYTTVQYPTATNGGKIWHWSQATGHRYITGTYAANAWTALNPPGAWTQAIDKPALGIAPGENPLYAQWGQCTTPGDVGAGTGNYGNWDVYATYSTDGGMNWKAPVNVTDTATPMAPAGQCLSESWASMAKVATTKLHVQYIKDLDAGGIPQTQGTWTNNPVIYQGVPVDSIQTIMSIDLAATLPIVIPSRGGTIRYDLTVTNTGYRLMHFDLWLDLTLPDGSLQAVLNRTLLALPPGGTIARNLTYYVPGTAPAGNYIFWGHLGTYPWSGTVGKNIWIEDSFPFSKSGVDAGAGGDWESSGWDDPTDPVESMPANHLIAACYPNPFNPTTVINYSLPQTANVTVKVYNVNGGVVAELVNGWRDAGSHQVTFDASNLASGMYLYRIQAGETSTIGKMLLVK
ncbi:MAG TPA: T9SS type A sorting domain-containing protein, partial [bacterium]